MSIRRALACFAADETGSVVIEAMLVLPALTWAYLGTFVFFDSYRAQSVNVKAAFTIGDAISRETEVTPEYIDSLYSLQGVLSATAEDRRLRVTAVRYFATGNVYRVVWSQVRGGGSALTNATLVPIRPQLPVVPDDEVLLVTESWVDYTPVFDVGLDPFTFFELAVTDPRFVSQLCYNSVNDNGTMATATC